MAVYRSLKAMGEAMERRLARHNLTFEESFREIVDASYVDHILLMSGNLSPSQTRGAFARNPGSFSDIQTHQTTLAGRRLLTRRQIKNRGLGKHGAPLLPINIQTGYLLHCLKKTGPDSNGNFQIKDTAPYAGFVLNPGGTVKSIDRRFQREIEKRFKLYLSSYVRVLRARLK